MFASAYENGRIGGELMIYALIIAGGVRLVHSLRRRRSKAVNTAGIVLMVVVALVTIARHDGAATVPAGARITDASYLEGARRDLIAGCTDQGARRSYCECVADRTLEASGHDAARLREMLAEQRPGEQPAAALVRAVQSCANLA